MMMGCNFDNRALPPEDLDGGVDGPLDGPVINPPDGALDTTATDDGSLPDSYTCATSPAAFNLLSPSSAAADASTRTTFGWENAVDPDAGDVVTYRLLVSDQSDFSNIVFQKADLSGIQYTLTPAEALQFGMTYYWKVEATDRCNNVVYSSPLSFTTRQYPICSKTGEDVQISDGTGDATDPVISSNGSEGVVAWSDTRDGHLQIYSRPISLLGIPLDTHVNVSESTGNAQYSTVASNGSSSALCYQDDTVDNFEIYCRLLSATGMPYGSPFRITNAASFSSAPNVLWADGEYRLSYHDYRSGKGQLYYDYFSETGSLLSSNRQITFDGVGSFWPAMAWYGSGLALSWHSYRDNDYEIYFKLISSLGDSLLTDKRITNSVGISDRSSLASSGDLLGLCWEDNRNSGLFQIYCTLISNTGDILLPEFIANSGTGECRYPQVIWGGTEFAMVYQDASDSEVHLRRFSKLGVPIASMPITDDPAKSEHVRLVATNNGYLAAWQDNRGNGKYKIYTASIDCEP